MSPPATGGADGPDERPDFCFLTNLASTGVGAKAVFATDEWFAPAGMLLSPEEPVFKDGLFTDFGKWMDGWETRRKRHPGHDWCVIRLGLPGHIAGFEIDTAFFTGNNVPAISILGTSMPDSMGLPGELVDAGSGAVVGTNQIGTASSSELIAKVKKAMEAQTWQNLLPQSPLRPGYEATRRHYFACAPGPAVTHLLVNYFPDGGVARLRAYGEVDEASLPHPISWEPRDYALVSHGGVAICWSDMHYGIPSNCLLPTRASDMGNGWETARHPRRPPVLEAGPNGLVDFSYATDWFVMKLGARCLLNEIEVDTNHFKGNCPESARIDICDRPDLHGLPALEQRRLFAGEEFREAAGWTPVLPRTRLQPHARQYFGKGHDVPLATPVGAATHVRVTIFPDGGISRLRLLGRPAEAARL